MVLEMGILVLGGAFAGSWLDEKFSTSPLFLLVLAMTMLVAGLFRLNRSLATRQSDDDDPTDHS